MGMEKFDFMLAKGAKRDILKELWKSPDWGAQEKFDGRRFALLDGEFISRHESVKTNEKVIRTGNVPHLIKEAKQVGRHFERLILDGEIVHGKGFGSCGSAMGSGVENSLAWQKENGLVRFKVFDIVRSETNLEIYKMPYVERHSLLKAMFKGLAEYIEVPDLVVEVDKKKELYEKVIKRGGEGVILKKLDSIYEFKRSKNWIKVKKVKTYDVVIMGFEDAHEWYAEPGEEGADGFLYLDGKKTKYFEKGWIGAIVYGLWDKKKNEVVKVGRCSGMDDEVREMLSNNRKKYVGTVIEIKANERMPTGGFRHPRFIRFRDDKSPHQCVEWM